MERNEVKTYVVHDLFHTIQGEGVHSGKVAVFVRFAGCNLWSGREAGRSKAVCQFCDTKFVGGERYTRALLVEEISRHPGMVVFTGGEPALQLDAELVRELQRRGRYVAIETNGTRPIPTMLDWVCVSPKAGTKVIVDRADELKLVYPQVGIDPWSASARVYAPNQWLSPMDGPNWKENVHAAIAYVKTNSRWRVNIQAHKFWEIA